MNHVQHSVRVFTYNASIGIAELVPNEVYMPVGVSRGHMDPYIVFTNRGHGARIFENIVEGREWLASLGEIPDHDPKIPE